VWGAVLADAVEGKPATEIVERDDGFMMAFDARYLLAPFDRWDDPNERRAMQFVRGRVLESAAEEGASAPTFRIEESTSWGRLLQWCGGDLHAARRP
jgi:hypothetical protein